MRLGVRSDKIRCPDVCLCSKPLLRLLLPVLPRLWVAVGELARRAASSMGHVCLGVGTCWGLGGKEAVGGGLVVEMVEDRGTVGGHYLSIPVSLSIHVLLCMTVIHSTRVGYVAAGNGILYSSLHSMNLR